MTADSDSGYSTTNDFTINVELNVTGTYTVEYSRTGRADETKDFTAGSATGITLRAGETATIKDIPAGTTYTVTEAAITDTAYEFVDYTGSNTGTIAANTEKTVTVNNRYTAPAVEYGTIEVSKKVNNDNSLTVPGEYEFTVKCSAGYVQDETSGTIASTEHKFTIQDNGEVIRIKVPIGDTYTITESDYSSSEYNWSVSYSDSQSVTPTDPDKPVSVKITNTFTPNSTTPGTLTVYKKVSGDTTSDILNLEYKFTVMCGDQYVQDTYGTIGPDYYAFTIKNGGKVEIGGLASDNKIYVVEEVDIDTSVLPAGYTWNKPASQSVTLDDQNGVNSGVVTITNNYTYTSPSPTTGSITFTKTFGGDVTEAEAAGDNLYFTITNASGLYLDLNGNLSSSEVRITLADMDHQSAKEWSKTIDNVPFGTYTVNEHNEEIYPAGSSTPYTFDASSVKTASTTIDNSSTSSLSGRLDLTNVYKKDNSSSSSSSSDTPTPGPTTPGQLSFTKTFGGDVTEDEAKDASIYFVITNEAGEYLNPDGTFTSTEARITLKDLDHTPGTLVWSKTFDVPDGKYTIVEHNEEIFPEGCSVPYTLEESSVISATVVVDSSSSTTSGKVDFTGIYTTGKDLDVVLSKEDIAGNEIADAVLTFTSLDGYDLSGVVVTQNNVAVTFTLSEDKTAISFTTVGTAPSIIKGLRAGTYELKEVVTPEAYLTAEAITFKLLNDGSTDCNGDIRVAGSAIIMVDQADPSYDTDVISAKRTPGSIPATGEQMSFMAFAGVMLIGMCAACFAGFAVYRKKKDTL